MFTRRWPCLVLAVVLLTPTIAEANPWAAIAKFFGEYFLGKAIDEVWDAATGKPDVRELDSRLRSFETALGKVDANLARSVSQLRRELDERVTKDQVRKIVEQALSDLEERVKKLEGRVDRLDVRVKEIEEAFGFLPTVPPSPLLRTTVAEGKPEAHPLTVEWGKLLTRSEMSRLNVERLSQELTDENEDMKAACAADARVLTEIAPLGEKVGAEFRKLYGEREDLLKRFKPAHRSVRLQDDKLASVLWLRGVVRPVPDGKDKGRLPVPKELVGPACSDILAAFDIANADVRGVVPLFRQLLAVEVKPVAGGALLPLTPEMEKFVARSQAIFEASNHARDSVRQTDAELTQKRKDFGDFHEDVKKLRTRQGEQLQQIHRLHDDSEKLLGESLELYVNLLKTERPTNSRMLEFRKQVLKPLADLCDLTACADWSDPVAKNDTWTRVRGAAGSFFSGFTNSIGMKFVAVPPGEFQMGAADAETGASADEKPQHPVRISKGFFMAVHEVTQADYVAVMGTNPSLFSRTGGGKDKVGSMDTSRFPVEQVSHQEAVEFCRKLSEKTDEKRFGRIYRLPTEAEWEYACRAGTKTPFHFGASANGSQANVAGSSPYGGAAEGSYLERTTTVGSYPANVFGLYDMHGNVWEWCEDVWHDSYAGAPADGSAWTVGGDGYSRVFRGGSWSSYPRYARSACRHWYTPGLRNSGYMGFRVVSSVVGVRTP